MFDEKEYEDQTKRPQEPAEKGVPPRPGGNTISAKEGKTLKPEPENSKQGRTRPDISQKLMNRRDGTISKGRTAAAEPLRVQLCG